MNVGYALPKMFMGAFNDFPVDSVVHPFVQASALMSKSFSADHWPPVLKKYQCLYCDDVSWAKSWEENAMGCPLELLIAPPASDIRVWKSKWGNMLKKLSYLVESQVVVPCKNIQSVLHVPEPYIPALNFGWYTWYDISPWHFVGRHLWIIAETPVQLWEAFCQLTTVGAYIDGVFVTGYSSTRKKAWASRPYGDDVECKSFKEAIITSAENFGEYWNAIATRL